jgi:DNA polymerase I-like protein with 3'-5' exonuclease and polymerase domains
MSTWVDIPTPLNLKEFYAYEVALARAFHHIEKRGVYTDAQRLDDLRGFLLVCLQETAAKIESSIGRRVAFSAKHAERLGLERQDYINLSYHGDIKKILEARGFTIPYSRATRSYTTGEDALNGMYAQSGDEIILRILEAREYTKILGTYVDTKLADGILYSSYAIAGTVNGRRSARKNLFGYGTNHQNLPKHSALGKKFRECIRARSGRILLGCDQQQAEDWVVCAIIAAHGGSEAGLNELRSGVDRHRRLASQLFSKPADECGKDSTERFMGKKVRHAGNYGMGPEEFARQMVKEGHSWVNVGLCDQMLKAFHKTEPGIRKVFHEYVQKTLSQTRTLRNPLGRERIFLGCRPFSDNSQVYKEAFACIPQGTVSDNTGLGILFLELNQPGLVVMDGHDAVLLEVCDDIRSIELGVRLLRSAFHRNIQIENVTFEIPIEFELGYNLGEMKGFKHADEVGGAYNCLGNAMIGSPNT